MFRRCFFNRCCRRNCCCKRYMENRQMESYDIDIYQLKQMQIEGAIVIDIRSPQEFKEGHIDGAINIPEYEIYRTVERIVTNKNSTIIVYCDTGIRSTNALKRLQRMGYHNVYNLYKGMN